MSESNVLVKVGMANENVVALVYIVDFEVGRYGRRPFQPCVQEDGQPFDLEAKGCGSCELTCQRYMSFFLSLSS